MATAISPTMLRFDIDAAGNELFVSPAELPNPKRIRLPVPAHHSRGLWRDAMRVLAQHAAGEDDYANLDDLKAFDDQKQQDTYGLQDKHNRIYT